MRTGRTDLRMGVKRVASFAGDELALARRRAVST